MPDAKQGSPWVLALLFLGLTLPVASLVGLNFVRSVPSERAPALAAEIGTPESYREELSGDDPPLRCRVDDTEIFVRQLDCLARGGEPVGNVHNTRSISVYD